MANIIHKLKKLVTCFIDKQKNNQDISSVESVNDAGLIEHTSIRPPRLRKTRIFQNFILVWHDSGTDKSTENSYHSIITDFKQVINNVNTFADIDECINFITDAKQEKILLILSNTFAETIVKVVHEFSQVSVIYIFCENKKQHEEWAKQWPKISGLYADISSMCEALKRTAEEYDQNSIPISFVSSNYGTTNRNLDQLDPSFMYTQILKEILLTIDFDQGHINDFLAYCREQFVGNDSELRNINKIEKEYHDRTPIWWYTYECFLYPMLNRSLRLMDIDLILRMGFFVCDLHNQTAALHSTQYGGQDHSQSFTVYRGQGLSEADFNQLKSTQGGLLSFNNFLSTSLDRSVSLSFAKSAINRTDLIGVLYVMTIDPSITATSFANIRNLAYFQEEQEVLFSMHSIFRIVQVTQIEKNNRLWQVKLILTSDNDPQLQALTEHMRRESFPNQKGWYRLGSFLLKVGQFEKAEQVFQVILDQTCDESEKANIYHMLGIVKYNDGKYAEAITWYEKSLQIEKKMLRPTHPDLIASYRNIATVYDKMGEYSKALAYHEKALGMCQSTVSSNHFAFSVSSDSSNLMNATTDDSTRAISVFEEAVKVLEQILPQDDLSLASWYDHYGSACEKMDNNEKALTFYQRASKIREKRLPSNHPSLAASYSSQGVLHENMGDPSTAHTFHQRAFDIAQKSLPANHPDRHTYSERFHNRTLGP